MNLVYQTISIILGRLFFLFNMRLQLGSTVGEGNSKLGKDRRRKDKFQFWDKFVAIHKGPLVQFKPYGSGFSKL